MYTNRFLVLLFLLFLLLLPSLLIHYARNEPSREPRLHQVRPRSNTQERDEAVTKKLSSMPIHELVATHFIFHIPGTDAQQLHEFVRTYRPGGIILMGDNMLPTTSELHEMTHVIKGREDFPPLIAIDQEGGTVKRIVSDAYPAGIELAELPVSETNKAFTARSELLASSGITLNFGIVADITDDKEFFIYPRVLGTGQKSASERVSAAVYASKGRTYSTLKHFPGHGGTPDDSHLKVPSTDETIEHWRTHGMLPFKAGIKAGAEVVMMGHLRYGSVDSLPASLSKKWYVTLEKDMGFEGIVITDDMFMLAQDLNHTDMKQAATDALSAGATMLLYVTNNGENTLYIDPSALINHLVNEVETGRIEKKVVESNARKVLEYQYDSRELNE